VNFRQNSISVLAKKKKDFRIQEEKSS